MTINMIGILLWWCSVGTIFIALGLPLWRQNIPPNYLYGFRTKKTRQTPEIWYDVNKYTGKQLFIFGCLLLLSATVMFFLLYFELFKNFIAIYGEYIGMFCIVVLTFLPLILSVYYYLSKYGKL
jgi:hypothetical protein